MRTLNKLKEAIYGGPRLSQSELRSVFRSINVRFPCFILAIQLPGDSEPQQKQLQQYFDALNGSFLKLHEGLAYFFYQESPTSAKAALRAIRLISGEPIHCARVIQAIFVLQQAILNLRKCELQQIKPRLAEEVFTFEQEKQTQTLVIEKVRNQQAGWEEALEVWLDIVLHRHQQKIHTVHRKLIECLVLLTQHVDHSMELAYPFSRGIRDILKQFSFIELKKQFCRITKEIANFTPLLVPSGMSHSLKSDTALPRAVKFILANYRTSISLKDVASAVHVSPSHLSRLFKKTTRQSLTDYLTELRIARARELLWESDDTVLMIALDCGFSTQEHFQRTFKKKTGQTPIQYRKQKG